MQIIRGKKLKRIFLDHWPQFDRKHPGIRPAIRKNVTKMLKCGTEEMGFHHYQCLSCGAERKVPHTCKSRFCPSCGVGQTERWIEQYVVSANLLHGFDQMNLQKAVKKAFPLTSQ